MPYEHHDSQRRHSPSQRRLAQREQRNYLLPCPACDGCGFHKKDCPTQEATT